MFKIRIPSKRRSGMVGRHRAAPAPWRRMLAAALCLGMWFAPAALGADSPSQESPDDGQLGGWVRMQHLEQVRRGASDGCDQAVNVFLMFDLVPTGADLEGLTAQLAMEKTQWAKSGMPQQTLEKTLKSSWNSKLAWLAAGGRAATKIKYLIETDGCHDIGGSEYTCDAPGDTASGEITLGEQTPTAYKQTASVIGLLGGGLTFNPMTPSVKLTSMSWAPGARGDPNGSSLLHQNGRSTCVHHPRGGGQPQKGGFLPVGGDVGALTFELSPDCNGGAPSPQWTGGSAYTFCVQPTACFKATEATQRQQCVTTPGNFAVIPFEGNLEQRVPAPPTWGDHVIYTKISWKICDGCGQVPPPPDIPQGPTSPVPKPDCDPQTYWDDYTRKWNTSQQLFDQAQKDVQSASKELSDWEKEEGKVMVEIAAEKYDLLQTAELALEEAATHLLHKLVGYFGIASTAAWIYTDVYPHVRTHDQEMENAAKEVDAAVALGSEAIADLKNQLSQDANCEDQRAKAGAAAKADEQLLDQAKQLRDEWQLEGSPLYKDPNDPNGYPLDARAALQRAIEILSKSGAQPSSQSLNSRPSNRTTLLDASFLLQATGTSSSDESQVHMVSVEQLKAALKEVQSAETMMTNGKATMEKKKTFDKKWGQKLGVLADKWK